jgi:hypothetical protein
VQGTNVFRLFVREVLAIFEQGFEIADSPLRRPKYRIDPISQWSENYKTSASRSPSWWSAFKILSQGRTKTVLGGDLNATDAMEKTS